ncbi:hypothetical protein [Ornithinibacillus contaminans]|uniref:hypothetical protein n=1 Tax=Ornithinibacillus contaminans TaxID=694055 RepID=UPI00064DEFF6|nr:hypothetical protein [Ornithinibacillus contaminans]
MFKLKKRKHFSVSDFKVLPNLKVNLANLREELETAITILHNFEIKEQGKLSYHSALGNLPHLKYNSSNRQIQLN